MKTLLFVLFAFVAITLNSYATEKIEKSEIKTSAICESCEERIEGAIQKLDGVKSADLNLKDKVLTVEFNSDKVTLAQIKDKVSKTGYDADDVKADPRAYKRLPKCCQKGGHE